MTTEAMEIILADHHPYIISFNGNRWQTHIADSSYPEGRQKIVRKNKQDLISVLYKHYGLESQDGITLQELYRKWLSYKQLHVAETCIPRIESDWKKYYKDTYIVSVPITSLTKIRLDTWIHGLIKQYNPTKTAYFNMSLIMRQMLDYAVDLGIVETNVFRQIQIDGKRLFKRTAKKPGYTQVYSDEELSALYRMAMEDFKSGRSSYELAPLAVIFQFQTGLRVGELCSVRYEDIENDRLHVQRMYQRDTGKVLNRTKGAFKDRYVFLTPESKKIIKYARKRQRERWASRDGYIFSLTDEPCSYQAISHLYRYYCKKLGIPVKSSHKARKTFISAALDAGINLDTVRRCAGHCDEQTTLKCYCYDRSSEAEQQAKFTEIIDRIKVDQGFPPDRLAAGKSSQRVPKSHISEENPLFSLVLKNAL